MSAAIQKALLILTKTVVMLIVFGRKARSHGKKGRIRATTIVFEIVITVLVIWNTHLPTVEMQKLFSICSDDIQSNVPGGARKELADLRNGAVAIDGLRRKRDRSEEHTSELQSLRH